MIAGKRHSTNEIALRFEMRPRISLKGIMSVRPSVPCYFRRWKSRILGASCAVYPALFLFFSHFLRRIASCYIFLCFSPFFAFVTWIILEKVSVIELDLSPKFLFHLLRLLFLFFPKLWFLFQICYHSWVLHYYLAQKYVTIRLWSYLGKYLMDFENKKSM